MLAELKSGGIVKLEKGCTCCTHNEPHWVHVDQMWRNSNRRLLENAVTPEQKFYAAHGMAIEDGARCSEKIRNFERLGIVRLIPEPSDELTDLQRKANETAWREMYAGALSPAPAPSPYASPQSEVRMKAREAL